MGSTLCNSRDISYAEALERLQYVAEKHRANLRDLDRLIRRSSESSQTNTEWSLTENSDGDEVHSQNSSSTKNRDKQRQRPTLGSTSAMTRSYDQVSVPLRRAVGFSCARTITALHSTPRHDSSAVHGFVLKSALTKTASPSKPVLFRVADRPQAVADDDIDSESESDSDSADEVDSEEDVNDSPSLLPLCVAITAGARIPVDKYPSMDAIVCIEDVNECSPLEKQDLGFSNRSRILKITSPVYLRQNRRLAGSDIQKGSTIISKGEQIQAKHILVLASLRFADVPIVNDGGSSSFDGRRTSDENLRKLGVAVLSAGSELIEVADSASRVRTLASTSDRNFTPTGFTPNLGGPYVMGCMRASGLDCNTSYVGTVSSERAALSGKLKKIIKSNEHEVVVVTGSVWENRINSVRDIVEHDLDGEIVFHGMAISPGRDVLMAVVPTAHHTNDDESVTRQPSSIVIFALPGDPVATAAAFHFLVLPYLNWLVVDNYSAFKDDWNGFEEAQTPDIKNYSERQQLYRQCIATFPHKKSYKTKPDDTTVFWLGRRTSVDDAYDFGRTPVEILEDQALHRVGTMFEANCWVIAPPDVSEVVMGDEVTTVDFEAST